LLPIAQIIAAAPTITSVTSSTSDGNYKEGDTIAITLNFSERVTLSGGNLIVTLETGSTDRSVIYYGTLVTETATAIYTVQAGDTTGDLTVSTITLTGGSVQNDAGESMATDPITIGANLAASSALVIDTTSPTVTNVTSTSNDGTYKVGDVIPVTVTFSESVTVANTPQ
jgi:hypothetical protein